MDTVMENYLQSVNFHYYIVYPRVFLEEYQHWWDARAKGKPLGVQYTSLLLTVCACTIQHLDSGTRRKLEQDWGDTAKNLTEQYHTTARELSSIVPVGYYHVYNVQQLLHSCYWYKSEAKFLECWHVLSTTVREAQELGFHKESRLAHMSDFDREMAKRLWCIINCWDWQVSSGLMRPAIIDRTDCDVGLPSLTLETFPLSPLLFMKMQSALINKLAARFSAPKNVVTPSDVQEYKGVLENWMARFPAAFAFQKPDTSLDKEYLWVPFHRYYLYTMAYLMILNPIRAFMAADMTADSPEIQFKIRQEGILYSLKLVNILREWLDIISHRDERFHFIIFALLDTSLSLSNAIIHDQDSTLPDRDAILASIDLALSMLKRLKMLSETAKASHDILNRLVKNLPRPEPLPPSTTTQRKKARNQDKALSSSNDPAPIAAKEEPVSSAENLIGFYDTESSSFSPTNDSSSGILTTASSHSNDYSGSAATMSTMSTVSEGDPSSADGWGPPLIKAENLTPIGDEGREYPVASPYVDAQQLEDGFVQTHGFQMAPQPGYEGEYPPPWEWSPDHPHHGHQGH